MLRSDTASVGSDSHARPRLAREDAHGWGAIRRCDLTYLRVPELTRQMQTAVPKGVRTHEQRWIMPQMTFNTL